MYLHNVVNSEKCENTIYTVDCRGARATEKANSIESCILYKVYIIAPTIVTTDYHAVANLVGGGKGDDSLHEKNMR